MQAFSTSFLGLNFFEILYVESLQLKIDVISKRKMQNGKQVSSLGCVLVNTYTVCVVVMTCKSFFSGLNFVQCIWVLNIARTFICRSLISLCFSCSKKCKI